MQETLLPDGRTFLGSAPVEQVLRVEVTPGRPKWASARVTGAKIGRALPPTTYEWTLSLQPDGRWTVDAIVPEAPVRVPPSIAVPREGSRGEEGARTARTARTATSPDISPDVSRDVSREMSTDISTANDGGGGAELGDGQEERGGGAAAAAVALVSVALLLTVGRWLGDETGVFGASLDASYWDDVPAAVTLGNVLD